MHHVIVKLDPQTENSREMIILVRVASTTVHTVEFTVQNPFLYGGPIMVLYTKVRKDLTRRLEILHEGWKSTLIQANHIPL